MGLTLTYLSPRLFRPPLRVSQPQIRSTAQRKPQIRSTAQRISLLLRSPPRRRVAPQKGWQLRTNNNTGEMYVREIVNGPYRTKRAALKALQEALRKSVQQTMPSPTITPRKKHRMFGGAFLTESPGPRAYIAGKWGRPKRQATNKCGGLNIKKSK